LGVAGTQITDNGVKWLCGLSRLQSLNIANTHISDVGLESLERLTTLQRLHVGGSTPISIQGVRELIRALPNCEVYP